ncbi:hypothetical protein SUGI_0920180 [Cryptomeria japonica]|uniref:exonuclease 1 n=1 Tax=Cryptomeria japonica TaxID=3369 RepID=UPI00241482FE|nr:exonuclease 1 [Cryptomeria japonica]GLJ44125.1 hypothetical protein SUGI_0920180 [Cryptomeria japonica]
MGVKDLLKQMKPYIQTAHIKKYAGKRVGIDAYSWLHKGAYSCSMEICQGGANARNSRLPYLQYCMNRINMLRYYNVVPVVVFDGGRLPSKAATEEERQRRRGANLEQAQAKLSEGDINGAIEFFQRAVEITPFMADELIQILKTEGVEFVVAPYEADSQLAYLSMLDPKKGGLEAVISEDSDLMAYGCNVVIYKMDKYGDGEEVAMNKVFNWTHVPAGKLSFRGFNQELFTGMCVLAGCDFLSSINGIGIKRAHSLVSKYKNLDRVLSVLQFDKTHQMPEDYVNSFKKATAVFRYAKVYDANTRCLSFLRPLPQGFLEAFEGNVDFLGPDLPPSMVIAIAEGRMDPISMEAFNEFQQIPSQGHHLLSTNESITSWNMSSRLQTGKNEASFGAEEKGSQILIHASYRNRVNEEQELEVISEENAEANCLLQSQDACPSDRAIMTHFRLIAEHSSLIKASLASDHNEDNEMEKNAGVLEVKGQKRVFPPIPDNNPFKKSKLIDSVSLGHCKSLSQKASHNDLAATHLCEKSEIQVEGIHNDIISNTQLDINEKEFPSPMNLGDPEVVSHNVSASPVLGLQVSHGTQVMKQTATQPRVSRGHSQNIKAPLISSASPTPFSQTSSRIKTKTNTRGSKSGSQSLSPRSSCITKFFTTI